MFDRNGGWKPEERDDPGTAGHSRDMKFGSQKYDVMGLFENSACVFMDRWNDLAKERAQSGTVTQPSSTCRYSYSLFCLIGISWLLCIE